MAALLRANHIVLKPWGDNQRYDLVIDVGGKFLRVQCKTARFTPDKKSIVFCARSNAGGYKKRDYRGDIEFFAVYSPDLDKVYIVPVEVASRSETALRLERIGCEKTKTRFAADFEIGKWIAR